MPGRPKAGYPPGMNAQRQAFVDHYISLREVNASEAARRAGCGPGNASRQAKAWLKIPAVREAIAEGRAETERLVYANRAAIILELLFILHASMDEVLKYVRLREDGTAYFVDDTPEHVARAVKKLSSKRQVKRYDSEDEGYDVIAGDIQVEMHDKNKAAQLLMGHLGILTPKDEEGKTAMQSLADFLMALPRPQPPAPAKPA